ncbi:MULTISPECIES: hypothetical protein [Paenibacillus]|nr:hypothetical protein [Paenibacillus sp. IHBB 10380]
MKAAKWLKQMLVLSMNLLEQEAGPLGVGFLHGGFFAALRKRKQF